VLRTADATALTAMKMPTNSAVSATSRSPLPTMT
jgi:hypothetical protein